VNRLRNRKLLLAAVGNAYSVYYYAMTRCRLEFVDPDRSNRMAILDALVREEPDEEEDEDDEEDSEEGEDNADYDGYSE
jgi:hypothetical protein